MMESIFNKGIEIEEPIKNKKKGRKVRIIKEYIYDDEEPLEKKVKEIPKDNKKKLGFIGRKFKNEELAKKAKFWALAVTLAVFGSLIIFKIIQKFT